AASLRGMGQRRRAVHIVTDPRWAPLPLPCGAPIIAIRQDTDRSPEPRNGSRVLPLGPQKATFLAVDPTMTYGAFLRTLLRTFDFRFRTFRIAESWTPREGCTESDVQEPIPDMR